MSLRNTMECGQRMVSSSELGFIRRRRRREILAVFILHFYVSFIFSIFLRIKSNKIGADWCAEGALILKRSFLGSKIREN